MTKLDSFLRVFACICILILFSGCGSLLKNMVGNNNVNSVNLASKCKTEEALQEVELGFGHQSQSILAGAYLLQALYYQDLGQIDSSRALFPKIIETATWVKNDSEVEKELAAMKKDLCKIRKRQNLTCDCQVEN